MMIEKFASNHASRYIQTGLNVLTILFALGWIIAIGFMLSQGAFELAGLFIVIVALIVGFAYANERPE